MSIPDSKRLVMVVKSGPAFSVSEVEKAHKALDDAGVPREFGGMALLLPERINWLRGQLFASRLITELVEVL